MNKIKVIDMPMGTGKTTGIIEYMNSNPNQRYMFVTPYRSERERIQSSCPQLDFCIPDDEYSRLNECNKFISEGKNIATTHALFSLFNVETINKLLSKDYILIIDEEPDSIFNVMSISTNDLDMLINSNYISLIEDNYQIVLNEDVTYTGSIETYNNISRNIDKYNFYLVDRKPYSEKNLGIVSIMNSKIFDCFKDIYILTYLFKDSNYDCYCTLYNMQYEYCHFDNNVLKIGLFDDSNFRCRTKDLIYLYSNDYNGGRLNFKIKDNDKTVSLTKNWYNNATKKQKKRVKDNASNFIRNICNSKSDDTMWSVYKDYKEEIKGGGCYSKGFIPCNCRATNEYRHKKTLAYLLNLYPHPYLIKWFSYCGIYVYTKHFPLTMLLQWIYRSQIRDGKKINLYLPSHRMREILQNYLSGEIC